jgi:hypothetical protein
MRRARVRASQKNGAASVAAVFDRRKNPPDWTSRAVRGPALQAFQAIWRISRIPYL